MIALLLLALAFLGAGIVASVLALDLYRDLKVWIARWRIRLRVLRFGFAWWCRPSEFAKPEATSKGPR